MKSGLSHPMTKRLGQPGSKLVSLSNKGRIEQIETDGLRLSSAGSTIQWASNHHCPTRLLGYGKLLPFPLLLTCVG